MLSRALPLIFLAVCGAARSRQYSDGPPAGPMSTEVIWNAVAAAERLCADPSDGRRDPAEEAASALSEFVSRMVDGTVPIWTLDAAAVGATAAVLSRTCAHSPCNGGAALRTTLEQLLLVADGEAERAFPADAGRAALFNAHKIFVADANYLTGGSVSKVLSFFGGVPPHLMMRGMTASAPFLTMTITKAFECGGRMPGSSWSPHVTVRGFNTFKKQAGQGVEDAFKNTPKKGTIGDHMMTVVRHEAAHQVSHTKPHGRFPQWQHTR
mmetsp:Transcript_34810/g.68518  ORF Transcript_34810/g.68518 Transcript_34810/m.68518 type:complete len:267 (+) Transcript_34810:104-904(+)